MWRTNIAVDQRLPGAWTGTAEYLYNRDVNGIYYINANLPAAQAAFTGADTAAALDATATRIVLTRRPERGRAEEPERRPLVELRAR